MQTSNPQASVSPFDLHPDEAGFQFRPCPFCGSTNIKKAARRDFPVWTECLECGTTGPDRITGRDADAAWNKREAQP